MCTPDTRATRFADDVVRLHSHLRFGRLRDHVRPADLLYDVVRPDGLSTIAVRTDVLPRRYLLGLGNFRLAQYLQLRYACAEVAHKGALFSEASLGGVHADDVHVITVDAHGQILGYVSLGSCGGPASDLRAAGRAAFPVEEAHGINVFDHVEPLAGVTTDGVRELKRFVHSRTMTDRAQRLRVTLELFLGAGHVLMALPQIRTLVGDVEEHVALRHLVLGGFDVHLIEGTAPALPDSDVMHLLYVTRPSVKPFVAHVPDVAELERRITLVGASLAQPDLFGAAGRLPKQMPGSTLRVAA